jgi:membrane-associated protein
MGTLIDFILHIDVHLVQIIDMFGIWSYLVIFAIIFAETGFVFTPFLPGDSLLFAVGALAALGSFNLFVMLVLLIVAAFLGDTTNYWIGHFFGDRIIENKRIPIKRAYIDQTHAFFQKHGGKTIVLARFVPIVRTFAPFVAGIGKMSYSRFISFNIVGGVLWVAIFTLAGYFFGNIPVVKHNFSLVIMAIIGISVVPMVVASLRERNKTSAAS